MENLVHCSKCGKENEDGAIFCLECGTKIEVVKFVETTTHLDWADDFKANFERVRNYEGVGFLDRSDVVGLFTQEYVEEKWDMNKYTAVDKREMGTHPKGENVYYVQDLGTAKLGFDKSLVNKALRTFGGEREVEIYYPKMGENLPLCIKRKDSNAVITIAPLYT